MSVVNKVCYCYDMAETPEPDELDRKVERARRKMDTGRDELIAAIREALAAGHGPSRIGRYARWSRDYITKIRDGKAL